MRVRRRTLALALPVALVLGLGACSPDDGAPGTSPAAPTSEAPSETPTPEPTETPEPEPTETGPTPPPRPAAMDDTGKKGAQAAAEYFIAIVDYAFASGDSAPVQAMTADSACGTCTHVVDELERYEAEGLTRTPRETKLSEFEVSDKDSLTGGYAVWMTYSEPEGEVTNTNGDVVDEWNSESGRMQFDTLHDGTGWFALALTTQSGPEQ